MQEFPLVSVIMAEYNTNEDKLMNSIKSILNQTYKFFEFIIIDDCGKNDVEKIVNEFHDDRIKLLKNEKNMGLIYSLNRAVKEAKGKYIARMDTDDFAYSDRLEKEVDFLEKNPQYTVVGTRADIFDGNKIYNNTKSYGIIDKKTILEKVPFIHPSVMMKTEDILRIGGYPNYKRCEDYALWINLFVQGYKGYVLNYIGIRYSLSIEDYTKRALNTRKDFFKLLKNEYIKLNPSKIQLIKKYIKTFIAGIAPYKLMFWYHSKKTE